MPLFFQHSGRRELIDFIEARAIALKLNKKELVEKASLFRQVFYKILNGDVTSLGYLLLSDWLKPYK